MKYIYFQEYGINASGNTVLICRVDRMLYVNCRKHAVRSGPVSERVKAVIVSNIMNISIYRKIDFNSRKIPCFFLLPFRISGAKMVASLCVRQQNEEETL